MAWLTRFFNKHGQKCLFFWIFVLFVLYATLSILRHDRFQSGGFDLGIYDQTVWQYSHFLTPYNTVKDRFILGDHLTLTLPLLSPLFWLWDDVRMLLLFQAFWISFSVLAVYKICRGRKFSPLVAFNLSFIYSLFYGIQQAVFFDFHPVVIGVGLMAWLIYFLETGHQRYFWITLSLFLLTQENMGIALACLGLIYLFRKKYHCWAIGFILGGLAWSLLAAKIISLFSPIGFQYWPEINFDPLEIISRFFDAEEKRLVWLYSLSWFSFFPLLSPGAMGAVFLDLAQYFVTGPEFARMWSPFMHHRAILTPFLFLGILEILGKLKERKINLGWLSLFLVISSLGQQYFFHFPLNKLSKPIFWQHESWMADNQTLFKLIPPQASLATQQNLVPHLSHRQKIYLVWPRKHDFVPPIDDQKSGWWLDFGGQPEYLVVDLHSHQWLTQLLETNENFNAAINNMEKSGKIKLKQSVGQARLYQINYADENR